MGHRDMARFRRGVVSWFEVDTLSPVLALSSIRLARLGGLAPHTMISFSAFALFFLHSYYSGHYPEYHYHYRFIFESLTTYKQPNFDVLKGKDTWGGVVSSLYYWRKHKVPLLHENLFHNQRFRSYVRRATWYRRTPMTGTTLWLARFVF
ncbi:hypothetical protein BDR22DRAFT_12785 [Usnea florida]